MIFSLILKIILLKTITTYIKEYIHNARVNVLCSTKEQNSYFCFYCNDSSNCDKIYVILIDENGEISDDYSMVETDDESTRLIINSYKTTLIQISKNSWVGIFENSISILNSENFGKLTLNTETKTFSFSKYFDFKSNTQILNVIQLKNSDVFFGSAIYSVKKTYLYLYTINITTFESKNETPIEGIFQGKNLVNCIQFGLNNEVGCFYDHNKLAYFLFTNNEEEPIRLEKLDNIEGVKYLKITNDKVIICSLFINDEVYNYKCSFGYHNNIGSFYLSDFQTIFGKVLGGSSSTSPLIINNMDFVFMDDLKKIVLFSAGQYDGIFISKYLIENDEFIQIGRGYFIKLQNTLSMKIMLRYILKHSENLVTISIINYKTKQLAFYLYNFPKCSNFTFYGNINEKIQIDFSLYNTETTFTEYGIISSEISFELSNSDIFKYNTPYTQNDIYLLCESSTVNKYSFRYYLQDTETDNSSQDKYLVSNLCYGTIIFCNENCETCSGEDTKCLTCKNDFVFKDTFGNCVSKNSIPQNYYEDKSTEPSIYKQCNKLCSKCSQKSNDDNTICDSCIDNYSLMPNFNCILTILMPNNYYLDTDENKFKYCSSNTEKCTNDSKCDLNYPILIIEKEQCVQSCNLNDCYNCDKNSELIQIGNYCYLKKDNGDNSFTIFIPDLTLNELNKFINEPFSILNSDYSIIFQSTNLNYMVYHSSISSSIIEKINNNNQFSNIDLGECGKKLESLFPSPLLIVKYDEKDSSKIKSNCVFKVYDNNGNLIDYEKYCSNLKIIVTSPVLNTNLFNYENAYLLSLSGYDVFDPKNKFFNDICSTYSSKNGNDVTLKDRQIDYYQEVNFCDDCFYSGFDFTNKNVKCDCYVNKKKNEFIKDMTFQFKNMFISETFYVVKCHKIVFNGKYFKHNYGCWILLFLTTVHIILYIYFCKDDLKKIKKALKENTENPFENKEKMKLNVNKTLENNNKNVDENKEDFENGGNPPIKQKSTRQTSNDHLEITNDEETESNKNVLKKSKRKESSQKYKKENNFLINYKIKKKSHFSGLKPIIVGKNENIITDNESEIDSNEYDNINYNYNLNKRKYDYELLSYEEAKRLDKRDNTTFYLDYLSDKQNMFNIIINNSILDMRYLKLDRFVIAISLEFFFNALFFTDNYISQKYKNNSLSFIVGLPKTIFSNVIAFFICGFFNYLSNNKIEQIIKNEKFSDEFKLIANQILKLYKRKLIIFFTISTLMVLFCLYFVTAFCAVYKNVQVNWIISSLESCAIAFFFPFITGLIIMILWKISLSRQKKGLFKVSKWLRTM